MPALPVGKPAEPKVVGMDEAMGRGASDRVGYYSMSIMISKETL
jgi:hypothetical protein